MFIPGQSECLRITLHKYGRSLIKTRHSASDALGVPGVARAAVNLTGLDD
jgi:hypothetical protein